jgi:hypothetical protein
MSNVVSASNPLTSTEIGLVAGLNALAVTPNGQAIAKTGTNTFANISASGGATLLTSTDTPNGVITNFHFATQPTLIFTDQGVWANNAIGFSWTAGSPGYATLPVAPTAWVYGI